MTGGWVTVPLLSFLQAVVLNSPQLWGFLMPEALTMQANRRQVVFGLAVTALTASPTLASGGDTIDQRFAVPAGFARVPASSGSFAAWLRAMKLKPAGSAVHLYTRALKARQDVHAAVIDIDVGTKDLQQCADAVMRLRAEWLFASGRAREVAFNDTGEAKPIAFSRWANGERPRSAGRGLTWSKTASADQSYASFRKYMDAVFTWAGTYSLERELMAVKSMRDVQAGDVIIRGGFPGHAVIVVDVAQKATTGDRLVMLAQSYMPAQEIHVLKNLGNSSLSPWYLLEDGKPIETPEWLFPAGSLKRWR